MIESKCHEWEIIKQKNKPKISFIDDIIVTRGDRQDWKILEKLHYKHADSIPPGSHYYVMKLKDEVIGVIMVTSPKLLLKERHIVFPLLKPGNDTKITNIARTNFVNQNIAVVARVIVDTMYRGVGLAYRFTNIVARMDGKKYVEIQSSMSKYNEFAHKAGFKFVPEMKSANYENGIRFFRKTFKSNPADIEAIMDELNELPEKIKEKKISEMKKWYKSYSTMENTGKASLVTKNGYFGDVRIERLTARQVIYNLQQMVLSSPIYGIYENPDYNTKLPDVIPLSSFDLQKTNEKLNI